MLRKAFGDAVLVDQILPSSLVERAKRPRLGHAEPGEIWTPAMLRAFLKVAETHRLSACYHLAAYTDARRGELLNLRWRDVDPESASIHIKGSVSFIAGERIEGTSKSGRSRVVSLGAGTVDVLKAHRKRQLADKLKVGASWGLGRSVEGIGGCPAGVLACVWIGSQVAPEMSGGVGGGTGGVVVPTTSWRLSPRPTWKQQAEYAHLEPAPAAHGAEERPRGLSGRQASAGLAIIGA